MKSKELHYKIRYADNGVIIHDTTTPWLEVVPFGEKDSEEPCARAFGNLLFEDFRVLMENSDDDDFGIGFDIEITIKPLKA